MKEATVEQAAKYLFPWMATAEPARPGKAFSEAASRVALEGALRILPHLPDATLLSIFRRQIETIPYEEGREFSRHLILMGKRLLASPDYAKAMIKLARRIGRKQSDLAIKRRAFQNQCGFEPPALMAISPSMRCNLRCVGCYAGEYSKKDDLGAEVLNRIVKEAKDIGITFMVLLGGEPLISDEILQMVENNPALFFLVYTNGTLITQEMADKLAGMGNIFPAISLEGFEAETDARRGRGTYARILIAMDNLKKAGVPFGFSATVVRSNNELISSPEFIDFYIKKGCFMGWYFNYIPIGRHPDMSLMPTPEQRIARYRRIRELRRNNPILLADFWCDGTLVGGCLAGGRKYFHINNKGDVEPCVFAHFAVDNIKDKSLVEILNSPFFSTLRSRQPFSQNMLRPCMIIDNPHVLRETVSEGCAYPTHLGAETIVEELATPLDRYASEYAGIADDEWLKERSREAVRI